MPPLPRYRGGRPQALRAWADGSGAKRRRPLARVGRRRSSRPAADVARLINAHTDEIAFIPNTTHGIGLIAEGYPWQPGDSVVTAAEEYPSNLYPWMNLADAGVTVRTVPTRGPTAGSGSRTWPRRSTDRPGS